MSRSKLEESNKTSFIIFGVIHEFLHICKIAEKTPKKTLAKLLGAPGSGHTRQARGRQVGPTGRRPTQAGSRLSARLDPRGSAATALGGGGRRRDEARPEWARGGAHGNEEEAASLTGDGTGKERRRGGGAMA